MIDISIEEGCHCLCIRILDCSYNVPTAQYCPLYTSRLLGLQSRIYLLNLHNLDYAW